MPLSKSLKTIVIVSPLRIRLWDPGRNFMAYKWRCYSPLKSLTVITGIPSSERGPKSSEIKDPSWKRSKPSEPAQYIERQGLPEWSPCSFAQETTVDGKNPANQLRLVVYPIIYRALYIPGGAGCLPSIVVGGFKFQPIWKNIRVKLDHFPKDRDEKENMFETTTERVGCLSRVPWDTSPSEFL